ncbi:MAG: ABC transporter ATP-binding protein [Bacteroidetes bacterium GWC2_33_15]|nr:MAG: ABC transporter ATP-binding protein [Bacteroidetes bacterium GWA2_33_15]OFX50417.1 MAG: ABC transporter ATP-binding protein [Bacteroidetes bacterium GWC2_33_15]OFX66665.1 MAG: ABC transporter ATP-binding protein [Bacteroidetes bacterium GWB2_32_14]OFX69283.1 MAG: ABC transporter ATP-binding protein [Bacteroidetes bacterium GWD2_33_33]HAN18598.1 ABC transporter ATP-binding protein [Bacteroidales bacterium]
MIDIDKWKEIINTLKQNKVRTFFTAFGVFWGIFMLIIMLGSGKGLKNAVFQNMGDFATNSCFMWTQQTSVPYKGFPRGRFFRFNNGDTEALIEKIPELKDLSPRLQGWGGDGANNAVRNEKTGAFTIFGDYPAWNKIDPIKMTSGRYINDLDIKNNRKVVVIGKRVVEVLFETDENPLDQYIKINGVYFKVVGVFKSKKNGQQAEREEQNIHMPFTTLQKIYNFGEDVGWYAMTAQDNIPVDIVETKAKEILKTRHSIAPEDDRAIGGFNVSKEFKKMRGLFAGINGLIWIVGIGTLLAGVIGVSNIMLVIIKERTKEIGIQRALGATPFKVIWQIINESVFLTSIAGSIGLVVGFWLIELINYGLESSGGSSEMFKNPEVDFKIAVSALIILIISGIFAGLIPAKRAVSIKPIDALRSE